MILFSLYKKAILEGFRSSWCQWNLIEFQACSFLNYVYFISFNLLNFTSQIILIYVSINHVYKFNCNFLQANKFLVIDKFLWSEWIRFRSVCLGRYRCKNIHLNESINFIIYSSFEKIYIIDQVLEMYEYLHHPNTNNRQEN